MVSFPPNVAGEDIDLSIPMSNLERQMPVCSSFPSMYTLSDKPRLK